MKITEYYRENLFLDIIGFEKLHGRETTIGDMLKEGYTKADVVDFALGMDIRVLSQAGHELENLNRVVIKPKNYRCACGKKFTQCEELYRVRTFIIDIDTEFDERNITCSSCASKLKVLSGIKKEK